MRATLPTDQKLRPVAVEIDRHSSHPSDLDVKRARRPSAPSAVLNRSPTWKLANRSASRLPDNLAFAGNEPAAGDFLSVAVKAGINFTCGRNSGCGCGANIGFAAVRPFAGQVHQDEDVREISGWPFIARDLGAYWSP